MDRETLRGTLATLDESAGFLLAVIAGLFLSLRALEQQRAQVCGLLDGSGTSSGPSVFPLRRTAGCITVGALGYFLCLSARTLHQAASGTPAAQQSACTDLIAVALVFAAAVLRLENLGGLPCDAPPQADQPSLTRVSSPVTALR